MCFAYFSVVYSTFPFLIDLQVLFTYKGQKALLDIYILQLIFSLGILKFIIIFVVLGFELRAYSLSHSISPFLVMSFSR
jgi:hypothetical protein